MEEIIKTLEKIVAYQLDYCNQNKIAPSNKLLNAIKLLDELI